MRFSLPLKIRWKILLALFAIGIGPLAINRWQETRSMAALGSLLAQQSGQALSEQTRSALDQAADDFARLINRERELIELLVRIQAREATALLRSTPANGPLVWAGTVGAAPAESPPGATEESHTPDAAADAIRAGSHSSDNQVFFSPADVPRRSVEQDALRLVPLTSLYAEIDADHPDVIRRQFVVLENGLVASYPGRGGFPEGYDARDRPWYRPHNGTGGPRWAPPHIDAVSGYLLMNATVPLRNSDGEVIGVAGIDVSVDSLLRNLTTPELLGEDGEAFVTYLAATSGGEMPTIAIAAQTAGSAAVGDWRSTAASLQLALPEPAATSLVRHMQEREHGYLRFLYQGRDTVCVYRPFGDGTGDLLFMVPADRLVDPAVRAARYAVDSTQRQIDRTLPLALAIVVAVAVIAFIGSRTITAPINALADAARRVGEGDFAARAEIRTGDELQHLGDAFNAMVPRLQEQTRVKEALNLAAEVQQRLLPGDAPSIDGIDIAGVSFYSDQTGGDYYDFLPFVSSNSTRLGIALGDVAGHGIGSALLMATVRALLHGVTVSDRSPADIMNHINTRIAEDVVAGQFMTLCYFDIDVGASSARWSSAGHEPAIVLDCDTNIFSELAGEDIPLGIDRQWRYREHRLDHLGENALVLLGTDGLWETRNERGEFYGKARLRDMLRNHQDECAATICEMIVADLASFRGAVRQHDDVTAVVFRLTPSQSNV